MHFETLRKYMTDNFKDLWWIWFNEQRFVQSWALLIKLLLCSWKKAGTVLKLWHRSCGIVPVPCLVNHNSVLMKLHKIFTCPLNLSNDTVQKPCLL